MCMQDCFLLRHYCHTGLNCSNIRYVKFQQFSTIQGLFDPQMHLVKETKNNYMEQFSCDIKKYLKSLFLLLFTRSTCFIKKKTKPHPQVSQ